MTPPFQMDSWEGNSTMAPTSLQPRDLQEPSDLQEPMDLLLVVFLEMVICLTFLLGYILNILIVVLFFRRRSFRTLSNRSSSIRITGFTTGTLIILIQDKACFLVFSYVGFVLHFVCRSCTI